MRVQIAACFVAFALGGPAFGQLKGRLDIPQFATLSEKASESVKVTLDSKLISMGCRFLNAEDPEQADVKKLCSSLSGIYVRSYTFDKDFAYPKTDLEGLRRQLSAPGWSRVVEAKSHKEGTNVDVFVLLDNDKAMGLGIIASEPRQFTIVNIVGNIDLEQLHSLEGKFNIPNLDIEVPKKTPPPPPNKTK